MATAGEKPLCKFGEKCYRKNPNHLEQFRHPKRKADEDEEEQEKVKTKKKKIELAAGKEKKIEDFFGGAKSKKKDEDPKPAPGSSSITDESELAEDGGKEEEEELGAQDSPADVKESIKQKFLVDMPQDFYDFWEFCKAENPSKPQDALKPILGFQLVGPFDILAGKHKGVKRNSQGKRPNYLLHWRYFYDPPEFQTIIRGDDVLQFHLGYFRDDPKEDPAFVAANVAKTSCVITPRGDNLFAAVNYFIDEKLRLKERDKALIEKLQGLAGRLKKWSLKEGHSLLVKSPKMKERDRKVVCKSFHGAGIVVPVDDNEIGYREVPETPATLKQIFKKIVDSKTEKERDRHYEPLQELITLVQFANDECDYGEGLELGMDIFCYGSEELHSTVLQLLPLAYMLLNRTEFETIIMAHLKDRRHSADLNQLA